jgi:glutamate racemase
MLDAGADTLVLGCTHYPFLDAAIRSIVGDRMTLIDTGVAVARQLQRVLDERALRAAHAPASRPADAMRFCSTGDGAQLRALSAALLKVDAPVEQVRIPSRRTVCVDSDAA